MPKYIVTTPTLFHDGKKYRRGDIIESDTDYGTRTQIIVDPVVVEKPKRTRRKKVVDDE